MKTSLLLTSIIVVCFVHLISAQDLTNPPLEVRVIAISSSDSSVQSVSNKLDLYYPLSLYVPTAFSPNGDGLNDTFGAVGEGIETYKLTIYNRWGEVVFASHNVDQKWDGAYKGSPVPFGAYKYEVLAYGKEIGEVHKSGSVAVLN